MREIHIEVERKKGEIWSRRGEEEMGERVQWGGGGGGGGEREKSHNKFTFLPYLQNQTWYADLVDTEGDGESFLHSMFQ